MCVLTWFQIWKTASELTKKPSHGWCEGAGTVNATVTYSWFPKIRIVEYTWVLCIPPKRPTETQATCSYKYSVLASSIIISTQTPSFSQSWHKTQRQMEAILNYPLTMSMKELVTSSQFVCQWQNCKTKLPHIAIAEVASANHWHLSSIFLQIDWVMLLCTWGRY